MESSLPPIDRIFECTLCTNAVFTKFESFQYHIRDMHNIRTRDALNFCNIYNKETQIIHVPIATKGKLTRIVNWIEKRTRPKK